MSLYNILLIVIGIVGAIVGIGSTLAIVISLFGTIGYKIHRKIKYGISLYKQLKKLLRFTQQLFMSDDLSIQYFTIS